ncbi:MAG: hypothetical protein HC854_09175 [Flavobacterium sp.]|nr:hypothetical protein [Flavobacterium sp.]
MGNKIITEKDFWMCTSGAAPAQLQGTRLSTKKKTGEVYITVEDKATSSWIDFGCTKMMLLMALAAAAVVVIAALTVATGGAALIAMGAIAGLAGAAYGAVLGTMLCGHMVAGKRIWSGKKSNFISQGTETITGDHNMTCPVGGKITFQPQIKNWSQALALAGANYTGKLMEGMMAGAAVGMGGAILSGGAGAFATGGMRGLGQATLQFAKSMPRNMVVNAVESVSKVGLALRGVMGAQNVAQTYGNTGTAGVGDFAKGTVAMETGAYDSAKNIASGNGTWQDYVGMAMMVAPVGQGKRDLEDSFTNKADEAETSKPDEETAPKVENQQAEAPKKEGDGEAYEQGVSTKAKGDIGEAKVIENLKAQGYTDVVQVQNNSGHGVDVIARNPLTGEVKCIEVKANASKLSADQKLGGEKFVESRLKRATEAKGHYKIPPNSEQMKIDAQKAQKWIENSPKTDYEVHQVPVDNTTGVAGTPKVSPWEPKP